MLKKTIVCMISSFFILHAMEKEVPVDYSHYNLPVDLPMDLKREIAKTIDQAINQENPEISGQMIRNLQLTSKNFNSAIDTNIEKIITSLAQRQKISKTLAALYIGNQAALYWYEKNKDKEPIKLEQLLAHYTGSKQAHAILDKIHMTFSTAIREYLKPNTKQSVLIDNIKYTANLSLKTFAITKILPDAKIPFFTSEISGVLGYLIKDNNSIIGIGHDKNYKKIIKVDIRGQLDTRFANKGLATFQLRNGAYFIFAVIQADKSIVLCYHSKSNNNILSVVLISPQGKVLDIYEQKIEKK